MRCPLLVARARLVAGLVLISSIAACVDSAPASQLPPTAAHVPVKTVTPTHGAISRHITLPSFRILPYQGATVYAKVPGYLKTITVDKGDFVKRGQLLAELEVPELLKSKALVDVLQSAIAISQNYQNQLHNAVAAGIAFRGDELRVQSQTEHYRMLLRDAVAQQRLAAVDLVRVLHLDVDTSASADSLVARAIRTRPELRRAAAVIDASAASRRGAVYGALIPAVGVQGFAGALGGGPDSGRSRVAGMADYTVSIGWRLGPGGLFDQGRINAASAQLSTAKLNQQKLKEGISAEVLQAVARVRAYGGEIGLAERTLASAQETLRLTEARRQFGVGAVLEDIQAQQALTQARSDYVNAIAQFNKAQYALAAALGERTR